jgi:gamma-glutamyltranspeptidase/glutathione hydrolase
MPTDRRAPPARTRPGARTSSYGNPFGSTRSAIHRRRAWLLAALLFAGCSSGAADTDPHPTAAKAPAEGTGGMVVSSQADASRAGHAMLARGGNAVDAAVATAFALAVTQPFSAGVGGGAFVLIRLASGEAIALDARETAPAAASRDMYVAPGVPPRASLAGPLAVATPGFVAGMAMALDRYGTLPLAEVLAPAIELAQHGFEIGPYHAHILEAVRGRGLAERFPDTARIQLPPEGERIRPGWTLVQADLAQTLRLVAEQGPDVFQRGAIAAAIADHMKATGGLVSREDLAGYAPRLREPLRGSYRGREVLAFPPPSSGVTLVAALHILEGLELPRDGAGTAPAMHRIGEALKLAFADRAAYLGDPDFVEIPVAVLTSKPYADALRERINPPWWSRSPRTWLRPESALVVTGPGLPEEDAGTTHLSTSDAEGNAVALTMTINTPFGSGITVPGTGVVLNNEMDDFAVAPDTPNVYGLVDTRGANAIAAGKRPLSSMTPTVVLADGKPFLVTGSPGGPRIVSTTLLSIVNVIDFGMDIQQAVSEPRFHHQWVPDTFYVEEGVSAEAIAGLSARGHVVEVGRPWSAAEAIAIDSATGVHRGGADPRRDGLAVGFNP